MPPIRILFLAFFLIGVRQSHAYSVQTHELLIDLNWKSTIRPFLLGHFPRVTEAQLERAHAFAYGGCAIQDLGYYPFGNHFFSDLTHYVRSGDFVVSLFRNARNPDELAFAVGALSHYVGDTTGHRLAINPAVAVEFPDLAKLYGPSVAYDKDAHAHIRTEFAFDINEITKHRMAPAAYLRHIGLEIPSDVLAKSFFETYGINLEQILGKRRRSVVKGYRFAVRSFLPRVAYAEVVLHRDGFPPDVPTSAFETFQKNLDDADFKKGWDQYRKKAGIGTHLLAWTIFILPKFGPFSVLAIRGPDPETHEQYVESMNTSNDNLRRMLSRWESESRSLVNCDLDTGDKVKPGGYRLTDQTYARLLEWLTHDTSESLPSTLKQDILDYYADPQAPISTKANAGKWQRVQEQLGLLRSMQVLSST